MGSARNSTQLSKVSAASKEAIIAFVENASLEVTMPSETDIEQLAHHIKIGTEIFLSDVPRRSSNALIRSSAMLAAAGLAPVPHIAVRRMKTVGSFERLLAECVEHGGVRKVMLIAGDDAEPQGPFEDVASALREIDVRRTGIEFVAVAAYPEGHPYVSAASLDQALTTKLALLEDKGLGSQIVTQFGFDPLAIGAWLAELRRRGMRVQVSIGVPGPASAATLMKFALRCGVRTAARGFVRDAGRLGGLLANQSERLAGELAAVANDPGSAPAKAHVFTFGGLTKTVRWISALQRGQFALIDGAIRLDSSLD